IRDLDVGDFDVRRRERVVQAGQGRCRRRLQARAHGGGVDQPVAPFLAQRDVHIHRAHQRIVDEAPGGVDRGGHHRGVTPLGDQPGPEELDRHAAHSQLRHPLLALGDGLGAAGGTALAPALLRDQLDHLRAVSPLGRGEVVLHHLGRVAAAEHAGEVRQESSPAAQDHQDDHDREHDADPLAPALLGGGPRVPGLAGPAGLSTGVGVLALGVLRRMPTARSRSWRRLLSPAGLLAPSWLLPPAGLLPPTWLWLVPGWLLWGWRLPHGYVPFQRRRYERIGCSLTVCRQNRDRRSSWPAWMRNYSRSWPVRTLTTPGWTTTRRPRH